MSRSPSEAEKILLEFPDGEQIDVSTLDQEDYEDFLQRMNALIRSYHILMDAKDRKEKRDELRNKNQDQNEESE